MASALDRECDVLCRTLTGEPAGDHVRARYRAAHDRGLVQPAGGATRFDRALVSLARRGPLAARCADAHARVFAPGGLLRRKLVLALALLECRAPERVDTVTRRTRAGFFAHAALLGAGFLLMLALSSLVLLPLRFALLFAGAERA